LKPSRRSFIAIACSLFLLLTLWSFSSPIGSGVDTDYHLVSTWCANGPRDNICIDPRVVEYPSYSGRIATVPYMFQMCDGRNIYFWPNCEIESTHPEFQDLRMAMPVNLSLYYRIMNVFASNDVTQGVLTIRIINSLITSAVLLMALLVCTRKVKFALLAAITFSIIPTGIQQMSGVNPRSWAMLGVMSSWAFLASFLSTPKNQKLKRRLQLSSFVFTAFLALFSRIDATVMVVITSLFIYAGHRIRGKDSAKKALHLSLTTGGCMTLVVLLWPRAANLISLEIPAAFSSLQYLTFSLIHIPEFVTDWWGYKIGEHGNGPGIIGIIGLSLYAISLSFALQKSDLRQRLVTISLSITICALLAKSTLSTGSLFPLTGAYTHGLVSPLLGITILLSNSKSQFMSTMGNRRTAIALISFAHAVAFYNWMEFFTRRGQNVGYFEQLSLNGTWWWDTWISPNFVFLAGALTFSVFLTLAWRTIPLELEESPELQ
jgi:hypothetical protein